MTFRPAPAIFTVSFCCTYVVGFALNVPLFLYYPFHGDLTWGGHATAGLGPAMAWYGLMANSVLVASVLGICIPDRHLVRIFGGRLWLFPLAAMLVCIYLLRRLFA